ncbi:hypothetical protein AB0P15_38005 [Streptomyces sp. NPDC087917]|uniref:hypothetical protein n=1 Tax=Streptomyces sp. NPDC087917 TaxID=3155060 RepID=UPI00341C5FD5
MKLSYAVLVTSVLTGVVAMGGVAVAVGAGSSGSAAQTAAADMPPSAVEDFQYPQAEADAALAARGIKLKSGDGHIVYTTCGTDVDPNRIEVYSHIEPNKPFCFRVTGNSGSLVLELPRVYAVRSNDYKVHVDMTVENTQVSFDVPKNEWVGVGKTTDPQKRDHALVALTASK